MKLFIIICIISIPVLILLEKQLQKIREEKFEDTLCSIRANGGKIRYMNKTTGTISYLSKDKRYITLSVYRGYNSHAK